MNLIGSVRGHVVSTYPLVVERGHGVAPDGRMSYYHHQCVLLNCTNVLPNAQGHLLAKTPEDGPSKRRPPTPEETPSKRPRLACLNAGGEESDNDTGADTISRVHHHTVFSLLQNSSRRPPSSFPRVVCMYFSPAVPVYVSHSGRSAFASCVAILCIFT